jgi:hypothetical protein
MSRFQIVLITLALLSTASCATTHPIPVSEIVNYSTFQPAVKKLISDATTLSKMNLTYQYGSANPKNKGMDCSGTIYYLLHQSNIKDIPRQSDEQYLWAKKKGKFTSVTSHDMSSRQFSNLKPGDLLFWSGTYNTHRATGISHVMLYLGKNKKGQAIMLGSSDGRQYQHKKMWGVSVFDFYMPSANSKSKFIGYGCIPSLTC